MMDSPDLFIFHGVLPICVENRLLSTVIDKKSKDIILTEFVCNSDGKTNSIKKTVALPGEITNQRIIGQPLCIGCRHNLYVFQFISVSVSHIQFFTINMGDNSVNLISDSIHYFRKDIIKISPIECHISPDKEVIMLRLPQAVLKLNKQSNILMIECNKCTVTKTKLLDKKNTCMLFSSGNPQTLLLIQVNDISTKCNLKMYDIGQQKFILQKDKSINTFTCDLDIDDEEQRNEDGFEDFDTRVMALWHTSAVLNRTGDTILLTCFPLVQSFVSVYGFDADTMEIKFSLKKHTNISSMLSISDLISTEVSPCNTTLYIHQLVKFSHKTKTVSAVKLPVVLNLKCQVRSSILRNFSGHQLEVIMTKLPKPLRLYISMEQFCQE